MTGCFFSSAVTESGVGRSSISTVVAPADIGKGHGIAETISEKQFRHRIAKIVLGDAENGPGIEIVGQRKLAWLCTVPLGFPVEPEE